MHLNYCDRQEYKVGEQSKPYSLFTSVRSSIVHNQCVLTLYFAPASLPSPFGNLKTQLWLVAFFIPLSCLYFFSQAFFTQYRVGAICNDG